MGSAERKISILLAMVIIVWGLNVVMVKYLTGYMHPFMVASIRMTLAGLAFLPFIWRKYGYYRLTGKQWVAVFIIAFTSVAINQLFFAYGTLWTSATNSGLILGLNPLATALLAAAFLSEKLTWRLLIGIVMGFSGVLLVVTSKSGGGDLELSGWGDFLMVISMLGYVVGGLVIKKVSKEIPMLIITAYTTIMGAILLNAASLIAEGPSIYGQIHLSGMALAVLFISAWGSTSLGTIVWNNGIKLLGAGKTAIFLNGIPFASMLGAAIFLGEHIRWIHIAAFVLTTAGIMLGIRQKVKSQPAIIQEKPHFSGN